MLCVVIMKCEIRGRMRGPGEAVDLSPAEIEALVREGAVRLVEKEKHTTAEEPHLTNGG